MAGIPGVPILLRKIFVVCGPTVKLDSQPDVSESVVIIEK